MMCCTSVSGSEKDVWTLPDVDFSAEEVCSKLSANASYCSFRCGFSHLSYDSDARGQAPV